MGLSTFLLLLVVIFKAFRCFFFLLLPQVFSSRGRTAVMAYIFILTLTGPALNIVKNMDVLTGCLACGQEQLKQAAQGLLDAAKAPLVTVKEALKKIMVTIEKTVKKVEVLVNEISEIINSLGMII